MKRAPKICVAYFFLAHAVRFVCRPCRRCWKKADILTAAMHAEIDAEVGRTKAIGNFKEIDELESLVSRMSVGAKGGEVDEDTSLALIEGWGCRPEQNHMRVPWTRWKDGCL